MAAVSKRPEHPEDFPLDDDRHWYDQEHMHWQVEKLPMPESSADGPEGKRVFCNIPMDHPYMDHMAEGMRQLAELYDIEFELTGTDGSTESEVAFAEKVLLSKPDLLIHLMPEFIKIKGLYRKIYEAGIPIIGCNLMPSQEDLPYILSWTGPNDWEMSRELARHFARYMNYRGGYTLIQHYEGTSCNLARTWGVIAELKKIAPAMTCLDFCSTQMDQDSTEKAVNIWLDRFGDGLKGIVSADSIVQKGIFKAMADHRRDDIVCVTHWSPPEALRFIKQGRLKATTYQSGFIDGTLAMQTAIDWFNGFEISPVSFMPVHVITRDDVELFLTRKNELPVVDYLPYTEALKLGDPEGVDLFFEDLAGRFRDCSLLTAEYCSGVAIEILSHFIHISSEAGINNHSLTGCSNPATLTKRIVHQKSIDHTFRWLREISGKFCELVKKEQSLKVPIEEIVQYVRVNSEKPLSLKVLSYRYNLTAAYLGQLYKKHTGHNFSSHLNTIRVEKAKLLLQNLQLKEYEVAREAGYSDASYFFRIFKKQTGMNPSEYREKITSEKG